MASYDPNVLARFNQVPQSSSGGYTKLLIFSSTVFAITLVFYLGLEFGYNPFLQKAILQKDAEINQLAQTIPLEDKDNLLKFYSQLKNLNTVFDSHVVNSKLMPFVERMINKKVTYETFGVEVDKRKINFAGRAESFDVLFQQFQAFKQSPEVEQFELNSADLAKNGVSFTASLTLKPAIFK